MPANWFPTNSEWSITALTTPALVPMCAPFTPLLLVLPLEKPLPNPLRIDGARWGGEARGREFGLVLAGTLDRADSDRCRPGDPDR